MINTVPNHWKWQKFGEIVNNFDGRRIPVKLTERKAGLYPYYGASGIVDYVDEYIFDGEYLLVSEDGANLIARTYPIAFKADGKFWVNNHAHVVQPKEFVDIDFLMYYFAILDIGEYVAGAAQPKLSQGNLNKIPIPLPLLDEQKRIAALIDEQMQAIEDARRAAQAELEAANRLIESLKDEIFQSNEFLNYPLQTIGEVSILVRDGPHVTPHYINNGIPFVTVKNIINRKLDLSDTKFISREDHEIFSKQAKAEFGDILYSKDGTLGIPCVIDIHDEFSFFVSVALIKLKKDVVDSQYVALALDSKLGRSQVETLATGSGLKHMVLKSIKALQIPVPSLETQQKFVKLFKQKRLFADQIVHSCEERLKAIDMLPAAILRRAFNGEY